MSLFDTQQTRGRAGELQVLLRLWNENLNHPAPGDSMHSIIDVSTVTEFQKRGVDFVETWDDKWGGHHELWHEVKTDYMAASAPWKHPTPEWADIASYYFGEPWNKGTGNLFIETMQRQTPGWYEVIQQIDPRKHNAENRIMWFLLPPIDEPPAKPWEATQYEKPYIIIAAPYRGLIETVERWKAKRKLRLITTGTSQGYAMPVTELWNWTRETRRRAEDMQPYKVEGLRSATGSGALLYVHHDTGALMAETPEDRERKATQRSQAAARFDSPHEKPEQRFI